MRTHGLVGKHAEDAIPVSHLDLVECPPVAALSTRSSSTGRRATSSTATSEPSWRSTAASRQSRPHGPMFLLTHRPPDRPDPDVTCLSGDIGEAVATALEAAGGKDLQILGADIAGQCLQRGLVDEIAVQVLPILLGDGVPFSPPGLARIDLEPISSTQAGAATILRFCVRK
jgi:dihydrofolate reductase